MYSEKLLDHADNPRNVGTLDPAAPDVGTGLVGAPACGDVMRLQIRVNEDGVIEEARFKTFGCGSAIASSSLVTEWVKGRTVADALAIKNTEVARELALPPVKVHCSVLAEDAIKAAVADWRRKRAGAQGPGRGVSAAAPATARDEPVPAPGDAPGAAGRPGGR
jgi:nitrogen fixation NifU-like protein